MVRSFVRKGQMQTEILVVIRSCGRCLNLRPSRSCMRLKESFSVPGELSFYGVLFYSFMYNHNHNHHVISFSTITILYKYILYQLFESFAEIHDIHNHKYPGGPRSVHDWTRPSTTPTIYSGPRVPLFLSCR